jgi:hypothetical protein
MSVKGHERPRQSGSYIHAHPLFTESDGRPPLPVLPAKPCPECPLRVQGLPTRSPPDPYQVRNSPEVGEARLHGKTEY